MAKRKPQPMQPIVIADDGIVRFQSNNIVRFLLDAASAGRRADLNDLARMEFSTEDWQQFYQLIGYSVSGYGDLSNVSRKSVAEADAIVEELLAKRKRKK